MGLDPPQSPWAQGFKLQDFILDEEREIWKRVVKKIFKCASSILRFGSKDIWPVLLWNTFVFHQWWFFISNSVF